MTAPAGPCYTRRVRGAFDSDSPDVVAERRERLRQGDDGDVRPAVLPTLSIVVPCFNEADVLPHLRERLVASLEALGVRWQVLFVDDGSIDATPAILESMHREDPRFQVISLSRNFGHQAAVAAGLSYAPGDVVAVMDADLQDPPEMIAECLERWRSGFDVVFAVRKERKEGLLLRGSYKLFYRLFRLMASVDLPLDAGDFCLMDRRVVEVLRRMPERNMFVRGMRVWTGFRQIGVPYERPARAAGETKYGFLKLLRLAMDGVFSFSTVPLRLATWLGLLIVCLNAIGIVFVTVWRMFGFEMMGHTAEQIPGWAGALAVALFLGAVQLLVLGILGEYLARIYDEVKRRPRWVVRSTLGVDTASIPLE